MNKSKLDRIPLANEKSMAENHCATISFCVRERENVYLKEQTGALNIVFTANGIETHHLLFLILHKFTSYNINISQMRIIIIIVTMLIKGFKDWIWDWKAIRRRRRWDFRSGWALLNPHSSSILKLRKNKCNFIIIYRLNYINSTLK